MRKTVKILVLVLLVLFQVSTQMDKVLFFASENRILSKMEEEYEDLSAKITQDVVNAQNQTAIFSTSKNENATYNPDEVAKIFETDDFKRMSQLKMTISEKIKETENGTKEKNENQLSLPADSAEIAKLDIGVQAGSYYYFEPYWGGYGDIFVRKKTASGNKSFTGHAALGGYSRGYTLDAFPGKWSQWYTTEWFAPADSKVTPVTPGSHLYYPTVPDGGWAWLRVRDASSDNYIQAEWYGANIQIDQPYNYTFRDSGVGWYCSELVAFAWRRGAGIDIIPQKNDWNYIWPMDLYNSPKTYVYRGGIY